MNTHGLKHGIVGSFLSCAIILGAQTSSAPQPDAFQQKLQQMQQARARNEQQLHTYQWIETTTLTMDGTSRPPRQTSCRYGADGTVIKTTLGAQEGTSGAMGRGLIRKHIAEEKKKKIQEEVEQIHSLTRLYLPFNQMKFKDALHAGKLDIEHESADEDTIILPDYAKQGDQLRLTLRRTTMQIDRISVKTYFNTPKDAMTVDVHFSALPDGTLYPSLTSIDAPAKKLSIATASSDFSKVAN